MQFGLVYGSVGALAAGVCLWRLILAARNPQATARWAVVVAIACTAIGFEAAVPQTYESIGRISGIPNLATLIVYSAITTAVMAQIVWTTYLIVPEAPTETSPHINSRNVILMNLAVVATMAVLFFAAPVHDESHATDFDYHYATTPMVDAFLAIYLCAYTLALLRIIMLCRSWLPHAREQPWLRRGLRLLAGGSVIAVGYSIGKTLALVAAWAGIPARHLNIDIAPAFASIGAAIMLIGYLCPSLLPQAMAGIQRTRAYPRLYPLWSALCAAAPEVTRVVPGTRGISRDRLYRRVIEIRDALLLLQPYLSPEITARAKQVADELEIPAGERAAAIEAARIAHALRAYLSESAPLDGGETFRRPDRPTFMGEIAWLVAVSTAYHRSPIVVAIRTSETST
ncbi:MAB_1171c family putative transporter [Nocardia sp. NBC_01388]|uniref:MAB_1171c family putative transporter n=1 Tax=Nocardia sp. NBC_01388 TaxID=2903596 RepID=UPI003249965F